MLEAAPDHRAGGRGHVPDLPSRLAKALMRLVDADTAGLPERKITITQKDLGNIIEMTRESTNKQLRIWKDKKWVRLEGNAVVILATDHLTAIAGASVHDWWSLGRAGTGVPPAASIAS
jgi:hypothetical protein